MQKKFTVIFGFLFLFIVFQSKALITISVSGNTNTVPNLAASYISLSSAITALNSVTSINGPVTFNMNAGTSESITSQITLTQAGSTTFLISFVKTGTGNNPKLTRTDAGTNTTTGTGGFGDGVLRIDGTDNILFNGLDIAASNQGIEYGYYVHKPSATNGCQSLSIRNAVITMTKGTSAYVTGIYIDNGQTALNANSGLTITSLSGRHLNTVIAGNTIQNVHRGIYCYGYSGIYSVPNYSDQDIYIGLVGAGNGNIIQNFGGTTASESSGIYCLYFANVHADNNTIQNMTGGVSHTSSLFGINFSNCLGVSSANSNTINLNNTVGDVYWIRFYSYGFSSSFPNRQIQVQSNLMGGSIGATSSYMILFSVIAADVNINAVYNSTIGTITKSGTSGTLYAYYNSSSSNQNEYLIGNNFSNVNCGGSYYGIYLTSGLNHNSYIDSNLINNIATTGISSFAVGIRISDPSLATMRDNTISNLSGNSVRGLILNATSNDVNVNIERNRIHSLNSIATTTSDGVVYGMSVYNYGQSGSLKIKNNLIGLLTAPTSNATNAISGIDFSCSNMTNLFISDVAFNTIYMQASSSGINFGTSGISQYVSSLYSTLDRLLLRNNIIVNNSTPSGTGLTTAFRRSTNLTVSYDPASNRNLFYAGNPSANRLIFSDGTLQFSSLSNYQSYLLTNVPAAERNSISELPTFQSLLGNSPDFLKFDVSTASGIESGGSQINDVPGDFANAIRAGQPGYSGNGSAPDLGAWELNGVMASSCSGLPATPQVLISNTNPCADSIFAVYLNPIYPTGTSYQWFQSTTDSLTGYTTILGATESYLNRASNINTWYKCLVTCALSNQSIMSNPIAVNITPLSGTYVISNTGSGQFNSFASAFAALHCRNTSGPVIFEVVDGQVFTETVNLQLRYEGAWPVIFRKQGNGINPIIKRIGTSSTSNYILELFGADHITFDGIDFEQTGTATTSWVEYGIHIVNSTSTNGAQRNTFKNGNITLSNANVNAIAVYCHSGTNAAITQAGTNSYNRFVNMNILQSFIGYSFDNTSTMVLDDSNAVVGENGLRGSIQSLGNGVVSGTIYGIHASEQRNFKVDSIDVIGMQAASFSYGIYSNGSDSSVQIFSNNNIQFNTSSSSIRGMALYNLYKARVFNNEIHELYSSNTTAGNIIGLGLSCSDSAFIYNNKIYNLNAVGTTTPYVYGISITGIGLIRVYNNMISDIRVGASSAFPAASVALHLDSYGGGQLQCYYNSIYLNDIGTNASYRSAGIFSNDTTMNLDLRNNIVFNNSNVTTGSYAVALMKYFHTPDKIASTSNNNLWYAGTPDAKHFIYYALSPSTTAQTLQQYRTLSTISPGETESISVPVNFVPSITGELRPNPTVPTLVEGRAQVISTIGFDYDAEPRHAVNPDLGADEGVFLPILDADCPTLNGPANLAANICPYELVTLSWSLPLSGRLPLSYDIYVGTSSNPPFVANTNNLTYIIPSLIGASTYYWKVIAKYTNGDAVSCVTRSFTTSNAGITAVSPAQRCGPGVVNLSATGGGQILWYTSPSSTIPIASGSTYSPSIVNSTTYYVSSMNAYNYTGYNVGKPNLGTPSTASSSTTEYLSFNTISAAIIDSVLIYPSTTGTAVLQLTNNVGTVLYTASKTIIASQIGGAVTVPVNWPLNAGTSYRIYKPSTSVALLRNTSGAVYPYTLAGVLSITSSSGGAAYYSWAYNWSVRAACESPKQAVTATVNTNSSTKTIMSACNSFTWPINGLTYTSSGIYTKTSIPSSGCLHTDSLVLTIGVSGNNTPTTITTCGSYIWPISGLTYTASGQYIASFVNSNGCDSSFQLNLTIQSCLSTLSLTLYLEGYYLNNGLMIPALLNQGIGSDTTKVDFVTIELRHATNYSLVASTTALLNTNGNVIANLAVTPGQYYIVIKHRHTVETWSANPILIGITPANYDFSTGANKAYGNRQVEMEPGIWALYAGDFNQDENVDLLDSGALEADINNFLFGYYATDVNGDGNVDLLDALLLEVNINNFIFSSHP